MDFTAEFKLEASFQRFHVPVVLATLFMCTMVRPSFLFVAVVLIARNKGHQIGGLIIV